MDLQKAFTAHIRRTHLFDQSNQVLIAVSTGVDSMTLVSLCQHLPDGLRPHLALAYVDHQLRTAGQAETAFIKQWAQAQNLTLYTRVWPLALHPEEGVEAAGRTFRYQFFYETMQQHGATILLTAHHGDDLLETILMKLVRSGDLNSVMGLAARRAFHEFELQRPLLPFDKQTLYDYATAHEVPYFEDASNQSDDYLRNRLRHHVLPLLKAENPKALDHSRYFSQSLSSLLALQATYLPQLLKSQQIEVLPEGIKGSVSAFLTLPQAAGLAFLQGLWAHYLPTVPLSMVQVQGMLQLLRADQPQKSLNLANGYQFQRIYDTYFIRKNQTLAVSTSDVFRLELDHWQSLPDHSQIGVFQQIPPDCEGKGLLTQIVELTTADWPLTVRHRQPGDRYLLAGGKHGKLKKLWIDQHVPSETRDQAWLIFANENLLWVPNFRVFQLFHTAETDKIRFMLCYKQNL